MLIKKSNLNLGIVTLQTIIASILLSTMSMEAKSFSVNSLKSETKEVQNKQWQNVGKFQLVYDTSTRYQQLQQIFQESKIFEAEVTQLNQKQLNLPVNIPIVLTDCDEENAFYDPQTQQVLMCYELFAKMIVDLSQEGLSTEEAITRSLLTGVFILYHEVGHALVDVLQLPITGKEEDTVDDFAATLLLNNNNNETDAIVLYASFYFSSSPDSPYWGEHSFGQQRFYNLVCLLYGKNPEQYVEIAQRVGLGESRARRCPSEYQQKVSSWQRLLAPHSINDTDTPASNSGRPIY
jgi:hypothetical protein